MGLEGVTVGSLARRLGMSKSGLLSPIGSRQKLLEAALEQAIAIFRATVLAPSQDLVSGRERLSLLITRWVDYLTDCPFPGGCFTSAVSPDLDGRPGPLRDRLREAVLSWRQVLIGEVAAAQA